MPGAGAEAAGPQRTGKDAFNGALIMIMYRYRRRITLDYSYSLQPESTKISVALLERKLSSLAHRFWLNEVAPLNISLAFVTDDMFQKDEF